MMTPRELARIAYKEYWKVTDFKNFRGEPMLEFDALPDKIKEAWEKSSQVIHALAYYEAIEEMKDYADKMREEKAY